jgi:hypothetical protein
MGTARRWVQPARTSGQRLRQRRRGLGGQLGPPHPLDIIVEGPWERPDPESPGSKGSAGTACGGALAWRCLGRREGNGKPRKRPSAQNLSDGLTKCLTGVPFLDGRARLLGHAVPFPEAPGS